MGLGPASLHIRTKIVPILLCKHSLSLSIPFLYPTQYWYRRGSMTLIDLNISKLVFPIYWVIISFIHPFIYSTTYPFIHLSLCPSDKYWIPDKYRGSDRHHFDTHSSRVPIQGRSELYHWGALLKCLVIRISPSYGQRIKVMWLPITHRGIGTEDG